MKKFVQSRGFVVSVLAACCIVILGTCWLTSRDKGSEFIPDESPVPGSSSWAEAGGSTGKSGRGLENSNGSLTDSDKEEYPKTISETEDEVVIDFTDTEKPEPTPPPVPEGKTEIKDPGPEHPVNTDPTVTAPSKEPSESNTPSPGSSNGNGAVYDPVFGWVVPGEIQQSTGSSDGDINKQVGNMG